MPVSKQALTNLSPDQMTAWRAMGPGLQAAVGRQFDAMRQRGEELNISMFMAMWMYQTPPGGAVATCAATGAPFEPNGLLAPRLLRLEPNLGISPENVVLVCHAYHRMRSMTRLFGSTGHEKVMTFMRLALENAREDLCNPPWLDDLDPDAGDQ